MSTSPTATEVASPHQDAPSAYANAKITQNGSESHRDPGRSPTSSEDPGTRTNSPTLISCSNNNLRHSLIEPIFTNTLAGIGSGSQLLGSAKKGSAKLARRDTTGKDIKEKRDADGSARAGPPLTSSPAIDPLSHVCPRISRGI